MFICFNIFQKLILSILVCHKKVGKFFKLANVTINIHQIIFRFMIDWSWYLIVPVGTFEFYAESVIFNLSVFFGETQTSFFFFLQTTQIQKNWINIKSSDKINLWIKKRSSSSLRFKSTYKKSIPIVDTI